MIRSDTLYCDAIRGRIYTVYFDPNNGVSSQPGSMDMIVYPNPASDAFTVRSALERLNISMFDVLGRSVPLVPRASGGYASNLFHTFDISGALTGIYFLRISTSNRSFVSTLLINGK